MQHVCLIMAAVDPVGVFVIDRISPQFALIVSAPDALMCVYAWGVRIGAMTMTIQCRAREFEIFEEAEDYALKRGGAALTMPGGRYLAISRRDCDRIEKVGGPATARFVDRPTRGGHCYIAVGY